MSRLRSGVLTVGAVLGSLCLLLALAGLVLDVKPLIFRSGSMGPEIPAGSIGLARPVAAPELEVGEVVSVIASNRTRVTHRIVGINGNGPSRNLTLQGDTNSVPDAETYAVTGADRVFFSVPGVGYAIAWLGRPIGLFLLGGAAVGVLLLGFRRPEPRGGGRHRVSTAVVAPAVASVMLLLATSGTSAAFQDVGTVTTGTLTGHLVVSPSSATCSAGLLSATVSWPADARYDYEVLLRRVSNNQVVSGPTQITGSASSRTFSSLSSGLGLGTFDFQVEIKAYLANAPTWVAPSVHIYKYVRVVAILVGATASCTNTSGT